MAVRVVDILVLDPGKRPLDKRERSVCNIGTEHVIHFHKEILVVRPCPFCVEVQIDYIIRIHIDPVVLRFPTIEDSVAIDVRQAEGPGKFRRIPLRVGGCGCNELVRADDRGKRGIDVRLSVKTRQDQCSSDEGLAFAEMGRMPCVVPEEVDVIGHSRLAVESPPDPYGTRTDRR